MKNLERKNKMMSNPKILIGLNKTAASIINRSFFGQPLPMQMRNAINKAKKEISKAPKNNVNKVKRV